MSQGEHVGQHHAVLEPRSRGTVISIPQDLKGAAWRKSSRSNGSGGQCVILGHVPGFGAVKDSKNTAGPALVFAEADLAAFVAQAKIGRFDS